MLLIQKLRESAQIPANATAGSAGYDLCADLEAPIVIPAGELRLVPTGIAVAIEDGFAGFVFARSGLAIKHGIAPGNCVGVIDSDYRGEVMVGLRNHGVEAFTVQQCDRVAQLVLMPVHTPQIKEVVSLDETARGAGGFGSTGR